MFTIKEYIKSSDFKSTTRLQFLCIGFLILLLRTKISFCDDINMKTDQEMMSSFAEKGKIFSLNLINVLSNLKPNENIVVSPFSVQTCGAMARVGATGETAAQLDRGLGLISTDINQISDSFHHILEKYVDSNILKIANKIYVMQGYTVKASFNEILTKKFFTTADEIDFSQNESAANTINAWVESKTNNLIKKLVSPSAIGGDTRAVLLNAIHFKAEWVHKFRKYSTHEHDFYLNEVDTVKVQMMSQKERFAYAELPELEATALELPYKNTDLTMLIILPNSRTGLKSVMEKLQHISLAQIAEKLSRTQVLVKIPKFKAEYQVELNDAFKKLGMTRMFSAEAEFNEMLDSSEPVMISKVIHKAFIDVNEEGTEAAAATAMLIRKKRSMGDFSEVKEFIAERPFLYFINHNEPLQTIVSTDSNVASSSLDFHHLALPLFMGSVAILDDVTSSSSPITHDSTMHDEL